MMTVDMRLHHVCFAVADLERSVDWYSRLLGADPIDGTDLDTGGESESERACFELPGGACLKLVRGPGFATDADMETVSVGNAHLCFAVDDLHSEHERLRGHASFRSPAPVALAVGANAGGWGVYLRDPDGNTIELLQLPTG